MALAKGGLATEPMKRPPTTIRYEHFIAGISGGVASTLILHPLDLIKIRFAGMNIITKLNRGQICVIIFKPNLVVSDGTHVSIRPQYSGLFHAISSISRSEGIKGLYRGVAPNIWGAGTSWGSYFFL